MCSLHTQIIPYGNYIQSVKNSRYFLTKFFFTYHKAQYSSVILIVCIASTGCQHAVNEGTHYYDRAF